MAERFRDPEDVLKRLGKTGYLADDSIASVVFLADLEKPVLVEGPAGVGKTELAKALYEWNYRKQLMRIQAGGGAPDAAGDWKDIEADIFSEPFLLERPLLAAIRATDDMVLLIDEVDRVEVEIEALLLGVLAALMALGHVDITQEALAETLPVLIKSRPDLVTARRELSVGEQPTPSR